MEKADMSKFWSETTRKIEPYIPGEQPRDKKYIKLNTNENPYPPSPKVLEAIRRAANEDLRLYPDPVCEDLRRTVADYYGLKKEQVFIGNGSDELLAFSFMAFFDPGRPVLYPDITYSFYPVYSSLFNIDYRLVPLDEDFNFDISGFFTGNGGIVISNPNAPTAKSIPLTDVKKILDMNPDSVVILDEAYADFGAESAVGLIKDYPNLLVIQTMSKSRSLAGMRIGFALGPEDLITGLDRIKNSFNSYTIDRIALAGAVEAVKDEEYFRENREKIIVTRGRVSAELVKMGFKLTDSRANFIFVSYPQIPGITMFQKLREKGILVRHFNKPRIENYLRVSIGSDSEMDAFLEAAGEIIKEAGY
jgi:histidinol-phosphate aminotransferase